MVKKRIKPLPYMQLYDGYPHKRQAQWLRSIIAPKLKKKLPTLYYGGWQHGFVPSFVQKHKKEYPYFLVADIEKFYSSVSHQSLTIAGQLAYKY